MAVLLLLALLGGGSLIWRARHGSPPKIAAETQKGPVTDPTEVRLRQAVAARPEDGAARLELGAFLEGKNRPFEAMWEYVEARRSAPSNAGVPTRLAAALNDGKITDLATAELIASVKAHPEDLSLRRQLGELYLATAAPDRAVSVLQERKDAVWRDADAVVALGRARQAAGDDAGAVKAFRRALELDERGHEAWYRLGRLFLSRGRAEEARDAFFHAMTRYPGLAEYHYYAGLTYLLNPGTGDLDRAITFFNDALARKSSLAPAHYQHGITLKRMGRGRQALTHFSLAALSDPAYPEPNEALGRGLAATGNARDGHRYLGRYYDLTDRPEQALQEFEAMAKASPKSVQPALLASQVYTRLQNEAKASETIEAALKRHPDDIQLLERLAILKINRGDRPYARRMLHRWLELKPKASRPCWLLGRCDFGDLKWKEGVAWLEKALERQPKNPHYMAFLGAGLLRGGGPESLERAASLLDQAVAQQPDSAEYRDLYGQVLRRLGRNEEALQQFLQGLNADPYRISCLTAASQLAWRLNRPGPGSFLPTVIRAVQQRVSEENLLWPHVWKNPADAEGRLELARFLCRTAELTHAERQLEQAVALRPDWGEARRLLEKVRRAQEVQ